MSWACYWCDAIVMLDDENMVCAHEDPENGNDCPGSHSADFRAAD